MMKAPPGMFIAASEGSWYQFWPDLLCPHLACSCVWMVAVTRPCKVLVKTTCFQENRTLLCSHVQVCRIVSFCLFYSSKWGFSQEISFPSNGKKYRSTLAVQKLAVPYKQDWGNKAAATQSLGTECTPAIVIGRCNGDLTLSC